MIPSSLVIEALVVFATSFIVVRMWRTGRRENVSRERGWWQILGGFCLLFFGAVLDLSDHFPSLNRFVILGQTPLQAFAEKFIGFLGGYTLLAVGFWRWLPHITERRRVEKELRQTTRQLEQRVRRGSAELNLKRMDLEREIRQRQAATHELRRSRELLEKVVGNAPLVLLACDTDGELSLVKGRAAEALGLDVEDSETVSVFDRLPGIAADLRRALEGESSSSTLVLADQTFEFLHSPWKAADGTVQGVVTVGTDVSELHQAHQELSLAKDVAEAASQSKSQFLANMSHELRTPLNSVIGFANVLRKNKHNRLDEKDLRYLDRIQDNGQHLLTLINEILDLSRIESGRVELESSQVDLVELVRETVKQLRSQIDDDVPIRLQLPEAAVIEADPVKLRQVLINLLGNAFKFTSEGYVEVTLALDSQGRPKRLSVQDTGVGIPAENLQTIFEPFQQVDTSSSRSHGGSGLGLSISSSLCRLMDFRLGVESEPGVGSTFWVDLDPKGWGGSGEAPSADATAATSEVPSPAPETLAADRLEGRRVLLIDDSVESRLLLLEMLQDLGCEAQVAATGEEGLLLAQRQRPDLIILDLLMPDMDGWQVLATLKNDPDLGAVPVLVASVVADEKQSTLLGALEVLNKPISRQQLEQVLARIWMKQAAHVLVVDDEEMIRHLLSELLSRRGYGVTTVPGGAEALAALETQEFDLVIVDLVMPGMGGRELITAIRRDGRWKELPVVVVTGMTLSDAERQALEERVEGILAKGFDLEDELREMVAELTTG